MISLAFLGHDIFMSAILLFNGIVIIRSFCFILGLSVVLSENGHD